VSIEMTGKGFYMSAFKNGVLLRNKMKKTGKKRFGFLLVFFCTLYGSYPISVCYLILFYE